MPSYRTREAAEPDGLPNPTKEGEQPMAKPDNRKDNVPRLQKAINHTIENLHEAEDYLDEHADEIGEQEARAISVKNEHRRESLQGLREEIRDEARHARKSEE